MPCGQNTVFLYAQGVDGVLAAKGPFKRESWARLHSISAGNAEGKCRYAQTIHRFVHRKAGYFHANTGWSKCDTLVVWPCRASWQNW